MSFSASHDHGSTQDLHEDASISLSNNGHQDVSQDREDVSQEADVSPVSSHCVNHNDPLNVSSQEQNTSNVDLPQISTSIGSYIFHLYSPLLTVAIFKFDTIMISQNCQSLKISIRRPSLAC